MKLADLQPKWIDLGERKGLGFLWRCSTGHCEGWNATLFANPLDGGPAFEGDSWALLDEMQKAGLVETGPDGLHRLIRGCGAFRWKRDPSTTTFENLTLTPSVDAHECGHWTVTKGECQ